MFCFCFRAFAPIFHFKLYSFVGGERGAQKYFSPGAGYRSYATVHLPHEVVFLVAYC